MKDLYLIKGVWVLVEEVNLSCMIRKPYYI